MQPGSPVSAEATPPPEAPLRSPPAPGRPLLRYALQGVLGLAVGLGAAEAAFRHRDGGAYPLVNVYEHDARRGVRLAPGSVTAVGRAGERPTHVRVNRDGYRGPDWPPPSRSDVLVIGDSLSFGLGVEEGEALPARLRAALPGAPAVLDASVPTYGPPEYLITMEQQLSARRPGTVILAVNLINDLAEIDHPNASRHTALDGFAARVSPDATERASSRLRTRAIQASHAAFALWRWARTREAESLPVAPEPGLEAAVPLALRVASESRALDDHRRDEARRAAALAAAQAEAAEAQRAIVELVRKHHALIGWTRQGDMERAAYLRHDGEPQDETFKLSYGGCAPRRRGEDDWRLSYFKGSRIRDDVEKLLMEAAPSVPARQRDEILHAFARRAEARKKLASIATDPLPPPAPPAPLPTATFFAQASALAAAYGAKLVVLIAPLDVQVAPGARQRRGVTDVEAAAFAALTAELAAAARAAGAVGVDAAPVLKEAGDLAFLPDGHLSPRGHDLAARALAAALAEAPGGSG